MTWYDVYFTPDWERQFRQAARKEFSSHPELVDDAFQAAWLALYEKLPTHKPKEVSDAYVYITFVNQLKDERRKHFGRCRPNEWVNRLGAFWISIAKRVCLHDEPVPVIAEQVCCQPPSIENEVPCQEQVENIVITLKSQPSFCSSKVQAESWPEDFDQPDEFNLTEHLSEPELTHLLNIILRPPHSNKLPPNALTEQVKTQWTPLSKTVASQLTDDDRLLLVLLYVEGLPLTECARQLNVPSHKLRYQHNKILENLQSIFKAFDIDFESLF